MMLPCDTLPLSAEDGDVFTCSACGESAVFAVLDDGLPGEWVWL